MMPEFFEKKIAWFKDPSKEYGYRWAALKEEIRRQNCSIESYAQMVNPSRRDRESAEAYLAALVQTECALKEEAVRDGLTLDEDDRIYWDTYRAVVEEEGDGLRTPVDLPSLYRTYKEKYFGSSIPEVSESFICKFAKLPFDVAGMSYLEQDAVKIGAKMGIRVNEKLREFPAEAKVALLHEMIHATGIRKHRDDFKKAVIELFGKCAYLNPLIL